MTNRRNYYRILHVQPDAPAEVIRASYVTIMQKLKGHPDLGGNHETAVLINEAFETLHDPASRAAYDQRLAHEQRTPAARPETFAAQRARRAAAAAAFLCSFCQSPIVPGSDARLDAVCGRCDGPLHPAERHARRNSSCRAIERVARKLPVRFFITWPQTRPYGAVTEDVSINGMKFVTTIDLVPGERVKIETDLCNAVAVVRHARQEANSPFWVIGVEFLTLLIKPTTGLLVSTTA